MKRAVVILTITTTLVSYTQSYAPPSFQTASSLLLATSKHHAFLEKQNDLLSSVKDLLLITSSDLKENRMMSHVARQIQEDFDASSLAKEEQNPSAPERFHKPPDYEWVHIQNDEQYPLAVRSLQPLIDNTSVTELRKEAEKAWCTGQTSRFTYQRPGNYEVHVTDLSPKALEIMNECLQQKIYPWIQSMFGPYQQQTLFVYDALIIRYNATEAAGAGAGQPLHRDLGLVSINIMLNEGFEGGGTFFENQLGSDELQPLKPLGIGHALAHYSSERHAGSATLRGVRDILVIFVSADESSVKSAILKQCRSHCEAENANDVVGGLLCRIDHQLMAIEITPHDGEAWQYLGNSLMDLSSIPSWQESQVKLLLYALECFQTAALYTPCDSRVYNNMGLVCVRLSKLGPDVVSDGYSQKAEQAYQKAWELLKKSEAAGCDVVNDFDALTLNYGLHVSNQDRFNEARAILERLASKVAEDPENRIVSDAYKLFTFCQENIWR